MINLTKLNEFKERVSKTVVPSGMTVVQQQQVSKIRYYTIASYEEYAEILGDGVAQMADPLMALMKKSIDVALGKTDDGNKKKTKGQASRELPLSE